MHKSEKKKKKPHCTSPITPLVCYTCMLIVYAGDVMLYLCANGIYVQVEIRNYDSFYEICML